MPSTAPGHLCAQCPRFILSEVLLWGKVTKYLRHLPLVKERI